MNSNLQFPAARPLLSVRRLRVHLRQRGLGSARGTVRAIEKLDLDVYPGEAVGVIGESGSGRSVLAQTLAGLQPATSGSIRFANQELVNAKAATWAKQRRRIQLIGPDSLADLRPRTRVRRALEATLKALCPELDAAVRDERIAAELLRAGLSGSDAERPLRDLSPVERQRLRLARALLPRPELLICDAPSEVLEGETPAELIRLLGEIRQQEGLTVLFLSRQPDWVRRWCDRVVVLYLGRVMEQGQCEEVFTAPAHPCTRELLAARLTLETSRRGVKSSRIVMSGEQPPPTRPPIGCVYHPRCAMAEAACVRAVPHPRRTGGTNLHYATCLFAPLPEDQLTGGKEPISGSGPKQPTC